MILGKKIIVVKRVYSMIFTQFHRPTWFVSAEGLRADPQRVRLAAERALPPSLLRLRSSGRCSVLSFLAHPLRAKSSGKQCYAYSICDDLVPDLFLLLSYQYNSLFHDFSFVPSLSASSFSISGVAFPLNLQTKGRFDAWLLSVTGAQKLSYWWRGKEY